MSAGPTHTEILDSSNNGMIAADTSGQVVFINDRAREILGRDLAEKLGRAIADLLPGLEALVQECLRTGEAQLGHQILDDATHLMTDITAIKTDGRIRGVLCAFQDMEQFQISAQRLESFRHLSEQWNASFKFSSDGIIVCDSQGNILDMNEVSEKFNGLKAKEIIGRNVAEFVKSGLFDRSVTLEVLKTKRRVSIMQYVNKTKKHLLVTGTPTFDETGKISLVVVNERDMTQLNALKTKLEQSRMVTEKYRDELAELSMLELQEQDILAESNLMKQILSTALKLARLEASNILIMGESGTGKGLLAKFIHNHSKRKGKPFIQINCAALPEGLLEAELFGYEKGAFTGAREHGKIGLFELSQDGTLFLDEIGDLPLMVQAKLLKYLDDNEIMRLGGVKPIKVDCTIIAATNRDLESLTKTRTFREDLFYRLNTFPMRIPPLRARREDILLLAQHYLNKYNQTYGMEKWISPAAFVALHSYPFPGNVRELKNVIKNAVVMSEEDGVDEFIRKSLQRGAGPEKGIGIERKRQSLGGEMVAAEKEALKEALSRCKSTREMAKYLHVSQPTIVRKLKKHKLSLPSIHK